MYIDATSVGVIDRRFESVVVQSIRQAMQPFELQLERIQVFVSSTAAGHVCRLHAWSQRGQTVVIECSASSRLGAVETAADHLKQTLASRAARGPVSAVPRPRGSEPSSPRSSDLASSRAAEPAGEVRSGIFEREAHSERPRVLLALRELDASSACLEWARLLASALEIDLDVCRVLPDLPETDGSPTGKAWLEATRKLLTATRETRRWCAEVLPEAELSERLIPSAGGAFEEAALLARERGVGWIVMPDAEGGAGHTATALARASGCPVLVARAPTSRSTLLIASDVGDDMHSISRRAAALAEALHAPVLAFHDVGTGADGARSVGSSRFGSAGVGSAGVGSAGVGSAGVGSAGVGSAGVGSAGVGSAGIGSAGIGSAGARPGEARAGEGGSRSPELSSRVNALTEAWTQIQNERLGAGRHQRLPELEVLLAHGSDRVETILQQARREDAEIIIVGVSGEAASDDVAAGVVDRAVRSVLVVPSSPPRPSSERDEQDDGRAARRSSAGTLLDRRGSPRAGARARPNDGRRWRAG